jgi:hypothetical protein
MKREQNEKNLWKKSNHDALKTLFMTLIRQMSYWFDEGIDL